jgi:mono/diheme cytochrome c family protein
VLKHLDDADWAVREQVAASLGALPAGPRETAVATMLERHADDPVVVDVALSGIRGAETAVLEKLLQPAQASQVETAITMIAATIIRSGQDAAIQHVFASVGADGRAAWQRSALLRGAEVALLNAPAPGSAPSRRVNPSAANLPCPTCPGGRAGPGGAYAFERPVTTTTGRGGARTVRLNREPAALAALASQGGELSARATNVLARIEWPGKPGAAAPVTPLTAEEQQRFNAGQEVYRNVCQACHQPDGRGQDKIAPSLVGSTLALAPAEVPVRILLNGKEGPIGLMPPVGGVLNDDQIAGVLTYIRREWGQSGSAVDPATVKTVRQLTADRRKPWTNDELTALAGGRGGQRP